jgi:hypothetical protein
MKAFLFSILTFSTSMGFSEVLPGISIPVDLSRSGLQPSDIQVQYNIDCVTDGDIVHPGHRCGTMTAPIVLTADGILTAEPADMSSFSEPLLENAHVQIILKSNNQTIFSIHADRSEEIRGMVGLKIYVLKIERAEITLQYRGGPLLGSPESQREGIRLWMNAYGQEPRPDVSGVWGYLFSLYKLRVFGYRNLTNDPQVANLQAFITPVDYYASTRPLDGQKIFTQFYFGFGGDNSASNERQNPLSEDYLSTLGIVNLTF